MFGVVREIPKAKELSRTIFLLVFRFKAHLLSLIRVLPSAEICNKKFWADYIYIKSTLKFNNPGSNTQLIPFKKNFYTEQLISKPQHIGDFIFPSHCGQREI